MRLRILSSYGSTVSDTAHSVVMGLLLSALYHLCDRITDVRQKQLECEGIGKLTNCVYCSPLN